MTRPWRRAAAAVVLVIAGGGACGGGKTEPPSVPAAKVSPELVPDALSGGLSLSEDDKAKAAFAKLPKNALVADGRLYAIRLGDRLVATLQLSTLVPEVDLTNEKRYEEVSEKLMPGVKDELQVGDVKVFQAPGDDKVVYVWFGRQMFEVLQVKSTKVNPEDVLKQIIGFQQQTKAWRPLPRAEEEF